MTETKMSESKMRTAADEIVNNVIKITDKLWEENWAHLKNIQLKNILAATVYGLAAKKLEEKLQNVFEQSIVGFICEPCKNKEHEKCPGDTHCNCQHRVPK